MNVHRFKRTFPTLLALISFVTILSAPPTASGQISQKIQEKQLILPYPKLEVKQFSGDFTQWGVTGTMEKGGLVKEFRWSTKRTGVAAARYEVSLTPFPQPSYYQQASKLNVTASALPPPSAPGALNLFTIDFKPFLVEIFGTSEPKQSLTFHVRLILLDAQMKPLSHRSVSQTVKIQFTTPAGGTWLDQVMKLRLKAVKCLSTTDGAGSDEIRIDIHGAALSSKGLAKGLYRRFAGNVDDGWEIHPAALLWEYRGLGFRSNVYIIASLTESDGGLGSYEGPFPSITPNSGLNTTKLIAAITEQCNYGDGTIVGGSCIGPPQIIPVTQADWNKVALGGQTVEKKIYFKGGEEVGGSYRLTFELSPK